MKKTFLLTLALAVVATACNKQQTTEPAIPRDAELEAKIEKKLAEMSLDEKIGQMLELNLDVLGGMKFENAKIDRDKLRTSRATPSVRGNSTRPCSTPPSANGR